MGGLAGYNRLYEVAESGRELFTSPSGMMLLQNRGLFTPPESGYIHNARETESILAGKRLARYGHGVGASIARSKPGIVRDDSTLKLLKSINKKLEKLDRPELQVNGLNVKNIISSMSDLKVANIAENKLLDELKQLKRGLHKG